MRSFIAARMSSTSSSERRCASGEKARATNSSPSASATGSVPVRPPICRMTSSLRGGGACSPVMALPRYSNVAIA
jgi:hypothetical protein